MCVCARDICAPEAKSSDQIDAGDDDAPDTAWAREDTWLSRKIQNPSSTRSQEDS